MDPRAAFLAKLRNHPELPYEELENGVRVSPPTPSGFGVELLSCNGTWDVYLGNAGYHESFTSPEEVLNFIAWCYSGTSRLREIWRGEVPQKSVLEYLEKGNWQVSSETVFWIVPYWRKRTERILQNPNFLRR